MSAKGNHNNRANGMSEHGDSDTHGPNLICPWCGDVDLLSWEPGDNHGNDTCIECNNKYSWQREGSVTYTAKRITSNEDKR